MKTNIEFKSHVVEFAKTDTGIARNIAIDDTLVDRYYNKQLKKQVFEEPIKVKTEDGIKTEKPNTLEIDLQNLNLTSEVVNYLYQDSRLKHMGLDINTYNIELTKLISNLRTSFTNDEILEKIKCI
jgi:tRNA(Glu) U13 pseudouridine synthase TruD